jgi:5-(carboxyamino)imidazole ribonucleotide synthase
MLAQEAPGLGLQLHLQAASASEPAVALASSVVLGDANDAEATASLARRCQVITFENEWVPLEALQGLRQSGVRFLPDLDALASLMSKRAQRELLQKLALPTPRWFPLEQLLAPPPTPPEALELPRDGVFIPPGALETAAPRRPELPRGFQFPLMAKSSRGGYDGKGRRFLQRSAFLGYVPWTGRNPDDEVGARTIEAVGARLSAVAGAAVDRPA